MASKPSRLLFEMEKVMTDESSADTSVEEWVTGTVVLNVPGARMEMEITVPSGPTRPRRMLPVFQSLTEALVGVGIQNAEAEGRAISCRKGCGACCCQIVPLSEIEAHQIGEVLANLPEPRRAEVLARFEAAYEHFRAAGLLEKLESPERFSLGELQQFGLDYFRQGVSCPFLEEGSCSIYQDRPLACREYLVTSPAENCSQPTAQTVKTVEMPGKVSIALCRLTQDSTQRFIPWVPLILVPKWLASHTEEAAPRPGPEILQEIFARLTEKRNEE
jgi:Fe-S-cluster containining protein